MSLLNTKIKPFSNFALKKGKFIKISEKDIKNKWSIFFFYPADFTFICPTELEDLANNYNKFKQLGVEIYSISTDTHYSHKTWHDTSKSVNKIEYIMVGDPNWNLTRNFEAMQKYNGEELGLAERATFIINQNGVIQYIEMNAINIGRSASSLLEKIKSLQYVSKNPEEVCPANWKSGKKTIKPDYNLVGKI